MIAEGGENSVNYRIKGGFRSGEVTAPASKSMAHRQLIAAALSKEKSTIVCNGISKDISATAGCLRSLGCRIEEKEGSILEITPFGGPAKDICHPDCNESGSTLRFLLPVACALGLDCIFHMAAGLAARPMEELTAVLTQHGSVIKKAGNEISSHGKLLPGEYLIPGNISSQYVSGLLFALPLLDGESTLEVTGGTESRDYIIMTENVLKQSGIHFEKEDENKYIIPGNQCYHMKETAVVEADWSNAAFFLCMGALSKKGITVKGLPGDSLQGDMQILNILRDFGAEIDISGNDVTVRRGSLNGIIMDASAVPDLVPAVSALASGVGGTTKIVNAGRLRLKESDRLRTTSEMLKSLGADIKEERDGLTICGKQSLSGGTADAANDHRIAMAAAVAACLSEGGVCVNGAECVEKSYPEFWKHLETLEVIE
ncbi:MAG: 3-phosphoshikimate 1-carboxyvinyltransferase [Clostridia bacterium]|nr:3-phosphoshikimate 1-carboxyvinyltransferase [Clostridia bacterium]